MKTISKKNEIQSKFSEIQLKSGFDKNKDITKIKKKVKTLEKTLKKLTLLKKNKNLKSQISFEISQIQSFNNKISKSYINFTKNLEKISENKKNIINPSSKKLNPKKILEYNSIILPYLKTPKDYQIQDKYLPWSFGQNSIENFEIENSNLYYKYKNNKSYKKLKMPILTFVNNSQKNIINFQIEKQLADLKIKNHIYIQIKYEDQKIDKIDQKKNLPKILIIYTLNDSDPSRFNNLQANDNIIFISDDKILKIKAISPGFVDSEIFSVRVKVEEKGEEIGDRMEGMVRPEFEFDGSVRGGISDFDEEDIFQNSNFETWHDYGDYSTPRGD